MKIPAMSARRMLAGLSLVLAAGAWAAPGGPGMMGHGPMGGPAGSPMGGPGGMFDGMVQRMLDRVNATPEQRTQIQQILQSNAGDLRAQHEAGRALREQAMTLFAQPTVDAAALEALRQKQMAMHDAASKRMTTTMLEVSRVLTPEQRKQMADYMTQRRDMMQRHQRERQAIDAPKG
ncbi:MAG: periplasmic heavy metal sensor [Rubrivivax sp.]|nr:periplasmic heavy metal sensor [Rubrivivax sp.]